MEKAFKWSDGPTGMTSGEYADYLDKLAEFKPLPLGSPWALRVIALSPYRQMPQPSSKPTSRSTAPW
jgi:hypothetical protein